mmetsp:Transcript_54252/g.129265  ORF Transcript_54252/g.129265 Transcript_54252/m.129265 type:complete len:351 (-) Transcript_54252:47-1099(-)
MPADTTPGLTPMKSYSPSAAVVLSPKRSEETAWVCFPLLPRPNSSPSLAAVWIISEWSASKVLRSDASSCSSFLTASPFATTRGVRPVLSLRVTSAPACRRTRTTTSWLLHAAMNTGVKPRLSVAFLSAPASTSARTTATCPCPAAVHSGVAPVMSLALVSAPALTSACTTRRCPCAAPVKSGVHPCLSGEFLLAPASTRNCTTRTWLYNAAVESGVSPSEFLVFLSAPSSTSTRTTLRCPFRAATHSGVHPSESFSLMLAPAASSRRTSSITPSPAAFVSAPPLCPPRDIPPTGMKPRRSDRASRTRLGSPSAAARQLLSDALHSPPERPRIDGVTLASTAPPWRHPDQ